MWILKQSNSFNLVLDIHSRTISHFELKSVSQHEGVDLQRTPIRQKKRHHKAINFTVHTKIFLQLSDASVKKSDINDFQAP